MKTKTIPGLWSDLFKQIPSTGEAARLAGRLISGRSTQRVSEPQSWTTTRERTDHLGCVLEIWERANKTATSWHWKTRGVITISGTAESEERARWFAYTAARIIEAMTMQAPTDRDERHRRRVSHAQDRAMQTQLDLGDGMPAKNRKRPARTGRAST